MLSSIFSSDQHGYRNAIVMLLMALACYFGILEIASRIVLPELSEGQGRQQADYRASVSLEPSTPTGSRTILIVGNSLLLHGIERNRLIGEMRPGMEIVLFPIEGTNYLDWFFGLQRLLSEGTRPSVVILCLSARQLLSNGTNGEGFAHSMMRMSDILAVKEAADLSNMRASEYFFANLSAWLGARSYVRNGLMEKWLPNAGVLAAKLTVVDPAPLAGDTDSMGKAVRRLHEIRDTLSAIDAGLVWMIPPSNNPTDPGPFFAEASTRSGVSVLLPYLPAELPSDAYSDGFHLNASGAKLFTDRVVLGLPSVLTAVDGLN